MPDARKITYLVFEFGSIMLFYVVLIHRLQIWWVGKARKMVRKNVVLITFSLPKFYFVVVASHYCDTNGCLSLEHLAIEDFEVNLSRITCQGVILFVRAGSSVSPGHIIQATPCRHGVSSEDGGFQSSCRKLQVHIQDEVSIQYCQSLL